MTGAIVRLERAYRAFEKPPRSRDDLRRKPDQAKELLDAGRQFNAGDTQRRDERRALDILV